MRGFSGGPGRRANAQGTDDERPRLKLFEKGPSLNQQRKFWRSARTVTESPQLANPVGEPSLVRWASEWAGEWARVPTSPWRGSGRLITSEFGTRTLLD